MMVTNALLGGIADTVAQVITAFRHRVVRKPGGGKDETVTVEIHELGRKSPYYEKDSLGSFGPNTGMPPAFDFERLTRFMGYGFCVAPIQFRWFKLLERLFPMSKTSSFGPALKRVAFDQIVFAPFGVALFFSAMTVAEGGGRRAISNKLRDMYVPTLKANYVVWPAVQLVNFRLMPVQYQLVSPLRPCLCLQLTGGSHLSRLSVLPGLHTCLSTTAASKQFCCSRLTHDNSNRFKFTGAVENRKTLQG